MESESRKAPYVRVLKKNYELTFVYLIYNGFFIFTRKCQNFLCNHHTPRLPNTVAKFTLCPIRNKCLGFVPEQERPHNAIHFANFRRGKVFNETLCSRIACIRTIRLIAASMPLHNNHSCHILTCPETKKRQSYTCITLSELWNRPVGNTCARESGCDWWPW